MLSSVAIAYVNYYCFALLCINMTLSLSGGRRVSLLTAIPLINQLPALPSLDFTCWSFFLLLFIIFYINWAAD